MVIIIELAALSLSIGVCNIQLFWNIFSSCKPLLDGCQSQPFSLYYPPINIEMPGVALHAERFKEQPSFPKRKKSAPQHHP